MRAPSQRWKRCATPNRSFFRSPAKSCPSTTVPIPAFSTPASVVRNLPSRPEGHSGGQPLPSVVKIKIRNNREHRGSQKLIGKERKEMADVYLITKKETR